MPAPNERDYPNVLNLAYSYANQFYASVRSRPVIGSKRVDGNNRPLNSATTPIRDVLDEFDRRWASSLSTSAGPRYLGFVVGGATPASVLGDWLTSVFDQNAMVGLDSGAKELELEAIDWVRSLLGIGDEQRGSFVSGATQSNLVGLATAREWVGDQLGFSVADAGVTHLPEFPIFSGAPHSSIYKAAAQLGLGRKSIRLVPKVQGRESICLESLERALAAMAGQPCVVVANCGTVNTGDFDDLEELLALQQRYSFWLHIDAAFGGFAAVSKETRHLVAGMSEADSICIDCHKWLNVPYDSALQFTRRQDLQMRVFQNAAAYLGQAGGGDPDFMNLTPENSRRFRALPAWFSLAAYGKEGYAQVVESSINCARRFGELIAGSNNFELMAPVRLNIVCFTLKKDSSKESIESFLATVRQLGIAFLTPTFVFERWAIRAAFSNWRTNLEDVNTVYRHLEAVIDMD